MSYPILIPRARTPLLDAAMRETLCAAYSAEYGEHIPSARLAILWSVLAFEHGAGDDMRAPLNGRACWNCWCFNLGNRRGIVGPTSEAYEMTAGEIIDGHERPIGGIWPAYPDATTGARTWLVMITSRYRLAWAASLTGSAWAMAAAMKAGGYYTASIARYAAGVATWQRIYERTWLV